MRPAGCHLCGGALLAKLEHALDPQSGERFDVRWCPRCGLGHTDPMPDDLSPYYRAGYYGQRHGFTARWCLRRRLRWLERALAGRKARVLDVGTGDGGFLAALAARGHDAVGVERAEALARVERPGVRAVDSVAAAAALGPYHAITLWHSLEHFPAPRAVVAELAAMLAPEGALLLAVPDAGGLQAQAFGGRWFHLDPPRHLYHFEARALRALLEGAGLKVQALHHQELEYDLFGWIQSAENALFADPNRLFARLTGVQAQAGGAKELLAGAALFPLAAAATALGTAVGRGATLVALARRG